MKTAVHPLTRREYLRASLGLGAMLLTKSHAAARDRTDGTKPSTGGRGIKKVVRKNRPDLVFGTITEPCETLVYQLSFPFQVAPKLAGLFADFRLGFAPSQDFEAGGDVVLFDDLNQIGRIAPVPVT